MRKFKFAKLVRNRIVEQIIRAGNIPHWRILSDTEYVQELKNKIVEEAHEIPEASGENLISELADIQELIDNLIKALGVTKAKLSDVQKKKNKTNGSFDQKHYIENAEVKSDSEWVHYYLKNPEKYPETM